MRFGYFALLGYLFWGVTGCAHTQLRRNVVRQTHTLADVHEQQVLNNIAAFVANPGATPSFALPSGGGTTLNHSNTANGGLNWSPSALTSVSAGLNGSRSLSENWTLKPINNPIRLSLMKCVYRYVTCKDTNVGCQDCCEQLALFFGTDFEHCDLPKCFFTTSERHPVKNDCCVKYGQHCGTYVIVDQKHFDCLSRIVMAILEIATISDEALAARMTPSTKQVDVTASFIAVIGRKPQLIQGTYKMDAEKFKELQERGAVSLGGVSSLLESGDPSQMLNDNGQTFEGLPLQDLQINPSGNDVTPYSSRPSGLDAGAIESLLQMNQFPIR